MSLSKKVRIVLYFLGFGLPLLAILSCSGFDTGSGKASCMLVPDDFGSLVLALVALSSFLVGIPIVIYAVVVVVITEIISATAGGIVNRPRE